MIGLITPGSSYAVLFYLFAALAVASSAIIAFSRDLARAIFMLLFALGSVAAFYGMLGADFLFAVQILIYVGGILVLLIFALMISQEFPIEEEEPDLNRDFAGLITGSIVLFSIVITAFGTQWSKIKNIPIDPTTSDIGLAILQKYLLPFEIAGVVLLVALVAATLLIRPEKHDTAEETTES
ncbi:MAG: NADH-quinone oxidoreductase subunit J [bacterium]